MPFAFFTSVRISSRLPTTSVRQLASIPRREWIFAFLYASRTVRRFSATRFRASFGSSSPNLPRCVTTTGARIASDGMPPPLPVLPLLLPTDLDDQLRRDLPRRAADVVLARVPFVQVDADQLDLHRRQAEIVDVLDSVPQGPPLAGQWDARRPKTNHALTERRMATARLLFCKA